MNTYTKIKTENQQLRDYVYNLLHDRNFYLSQSIMKGELRNLQPRIKKGEIKRLAFGCLDY